ncbi:hypothetical protein ACP4OV_006951 [Aristida adscensionis]
MAAPPPGPHHPPGIQRVNSISWLNTVFTDIGEDLPVVETNRCDATRRWSTHIAASIREGGLLAVERGEVQHIEVHNTEADVRTDHCFPDYNYFKLAAYTEHADDSMFNSFLHMEVSLSEVLRQVVQPLGYTFMQPVSLQVEGGRFQAHTTFLSDARTFTVYGEALETPYDTQDSAFIYALDYVDTFMGIDIVDLHRGRYLMVAGV